MNTLSRKFIEFCAEEYKSMLVENVLPFWLNNGIDRENGGVYTCLDRDGSLYDSTKSVWFQGRCAYAFSYAYNHIDKNPAYLLAAKSCIDFIENHCFSPNGHMYFEVQADGTPLRLRRYVFSESFAVVAMAEYALATGDMQYAKRAREIYESILKMVATEGFLAPKYEPTLKARGHSLTMILINTALTLRQVDDDPKLLESALVRYEELHKYFINHEYKTVLETVGLNGEFIDTAMGRTINPGHCIETAWFLMVLYEASGKEEIKKDALQILDWSWNWGWDKDFGGIINFRDCKGFPHQDYSQDMKFWWPQCETIIAALFACKLTGDEKYLEMHRKIHDWTFAHFPDKDFPEWYGYLHRDGSVAQPAKGNIFKGPFHIPRMLVKAHLLAKEILNK